MTQIDSSVSKAKEILMLNELIAIPTETVYGLAANAFSETAVKKVFELKNRPSFNPLIVHVGAVDFLDEIATNIPQVAFDLASRFWPGPLTLLLEKKDTISNLVTAGSSRVAIRIPNHPLTLELLNQLPFPLAAPSANPFMSISPTTAQHVLDYFNGRLKYILNGGSCQKGIESTIVGFVDGQAVLYREGSCSQNDIEKITGTLIKSQLNSAQPEAPGMLKKHYAPKTKLVISSDIVQDLEKYGGKKIGILTLKPKDIFTVEVVQKSLSVQGSLDEAARNLYSFLIELDALQLDIIITEMMPEEGMGSAINDRLKRASHF